MKRIVIAMMLAMAAIGYATSGFAQETKQPAPAEKKAAPAQPRKTAVYQGVVQDVDLKEKIVTAGKPKSELGMAFHASDAKLVGYKTLKDIKPGDKVKVEFDAIKSRTFAVTITKEE